MPRFAPAAIAAIFISGPALADLTAEEVLADHLNLLGGYGLLEMTTTGTTRNASGLIVEGFRGTYSDSETSIEVLTPGMTLTEQSDGSVDITYADTLPISIHADPPLEDPVTVTLILKTKGLTHKVSGEIGDITHEIGFDTLSIGEFSVDPPEAAEELELEGDIAIAGFNSTIRLNDNDPARRSLDLNMAGLTLAMTTLAPTDIGIDTPGTTYDTSGIGEMKITLALSDLATRIAYIGTELPQHSMSTTLGRIQLDQSSDLPEDDGAMGLTLDGTDIYLAYDIQIDPEAMEADFLQALLDGQSLSGALNFDRLAYDADIATPEGSFVATSRTGASENRFSLSEHGFAYYGSALDTYAELSGPALDIPLSSFSYGVEKTLLELALPLTPSEARQPFRIRMDIDGLTTDDVIWNLFDPTARLPRDPARLAFDLEGTTVLFADPFTSENEPPVRDTQARLNSLDISLAGATLTGTGSGRDTSTPGNPSGVGDLDMTLTGINTLIDTLIELGLLQNEQAMGARMGLGLIARPGDGEDTLVSKIEVKEDGQIFANGQRIK